MKLKTINIFLIAAIQTLFFGAQVYAWGCSADIYQAPNGARVVLIGDIHGAEDFAAQDRTFKNACKPKIEALYNDPAYQIIAEGTAWRTKIAAKKAPEKHSMLDHLLCSSNISNLEVQDLRDGAPLKLVLFYTYNYCPIPQSLPLCVKSVYAGYKGYEFTTEQLIASLREKIKSISTKTRLLPKEQNQHIKQLIQKLQQALTMLNSFDIDKSARFLDELAARKISHKQFVALGNILREDLADVGYLAAIVSANAQKKHALFLGGTAHCMNVEEKLQKMGYNKIDAIAYKDAPMTNVELERTFVSIEETVYQSNNIHTPNTYGAYVWNAIAYALAIIARFIYHNLSCDPKI